MDGVNFHVLGNPASKGSLTKMRNGAYLPAGTPASRMNYLNWKENISSAARVAMGDVEPWPGAIRIMAEFQLRPPAMARKYWGWLPHTKRPDIDKLCRALFDPLTGIVWKDDNQVCFATINKVYSWNRQPGAIVIVDFLTDDWCETYAQTAHAVADAIDSL